MRLLGTAIKPASFNEHKPDWNNIGLFAQNLRTVRGPLSARGMRLRRCSGAFAFRVSEETGRTLVIETAPDLNPATVWMPVFTNTAPFWFTNSTPADRQRFYRSVLR